ncbi:hypothetical protein ACFP81_03760 [Deinococcus lacus]|uniref:DUF1097 domain-containing protein n=1 Tax=Deinococcus lacus TaxID=392561 RepID=A0ABW1YCU0_9DEIO
MTVTHTQVTQTVRRPVQRARSGNAGRTLARLAGGILSLLALAYFLVTPGEWTGLLFAWVLLTLIADEFGGWFGYLGVALGALMLSGQSEASWILFPLVGGALTAALMVKHSGGWGVLPFAAALFALPLLGVASLGDKIDPALTLPAEPAFLQTALTAMLIGLGISLVRQVFLWARDLSRKQRLKADAKAALATGEAGL